MFLTRGLLFFCFILPLVCWYVVELVRATSLQFLVQQLLALVPLPGTKK